MAPNTTPAGRTSSGSRRPVPRRCTAAAGLGAATPARQFDAWPDRVDIRDWFYRPGLNALPEEVVNCGRVPEILDQGSDGACTGYALAAVIQFLLNAHGIRRRVSPWMLYEMARRYDEWPGAQYSGSSARGAMKGWVRHGVCARDSWPADRRGGALTAAAAAEAQRTPGGAFYRVMHRQVRDMHAALAEVGALYCTLMVHEGWDAPGPMVARAGHGQRHVSLPIIRRRGHAPDGGHAVAIVGYTREGFIVQNSWGARWGARGFALLPYEDFLLNATDVWAAQLGVPVSVDLWVGGGADSTEGLQRASRSIPLNEIRPYVVNLDSNGELSQSGNYWTTEADIEQLFDEVIPARTRTWTRRRVLLYLHGGLQDGEAVARRIIAFRDVLMANEIYPVHIMWESGVVQSLCDMIRGRFADADDRPGGVRDWFQKLRDGLAEAKDWSFEHSVSMAGTRLWAEMKANARLASCHPDGRGGAQLLIAHARRALARLSPAARQRWELHVVGHSAGAIFAAHALPLLARLGVSFRTLQFLAPALRIDAFRDLVMTAVENRSCPLPTLYLLSDAAERADTVAKIYGKSLLYLVSNAFEGRRDTPMLGLQRCVSPDGHPAGRPTLAPDPDVAALFTREADGRPALVIAGAAGAPGNLSNSTSHAGFDTDPETLNSVVWRVIGEAPRRPFTARDLTY